MTDVKASGRKQETRVAPGQSANSVSASVFLQAGDNA
jgi:hypothetical protein